MSEPITLTDYVVRDRFGEEWSRYLYPSMADAVCTRCNADPALYSRTPFAWKSEEPRHV
ncbi:hypothetical protein SAMN05421681_103282 [Lysobacter enzymogenes]|nr:hypothetical protein SAMN05421681_103282 [Lysobacter enzymogenes]